MGRRIFSTVCQYHLRFTCITSLYGFKTNAQSTTLYLVSCYVLLLHVNSTSLYIPCGRCCRDAFPRVKLMTPHLLRCTCLIYENIAVSPVVVNKRDLNSVASNQFALNQISYIIHLVHTLLSPWAPEQHARFSILYASLSAI